MRRTRRAKPASPPKPIDELTVNDLRQNGEHHNEAVTQHKALVDELRRSLAAKPRPVRTFASKAEKMAWLRQGLSQ